MSHHSVPSAVNNGHQIIMVRRRGPGVRVSSQITPRAAALTPPIIATATADSAAALRAEPRTEPLIKGSSTQGAKALGQASMEIGPRVLSIRGDSA
jgi:hypothetical protein